MERKERGKREGERRLSDPASKFQDKQAAVWHVFVGHLIQQNGVSHFLSRCPISCIHIHNVL